MRDPLRIYVVFDPEFVQGAKIADTLRREFDCIGMLREGLRFTVPVHTRSVPWQIGPLSRTNLPRPIDFGAADSNLVLLLHDPVLNAKVDEWFFYLKDLAERAKHPAAKTMFQPVLIGNGISPVFAAEKQSPRLASAAALDSEPERMRFMIRLLNGVLIQNDIAQDAGRQGHMVFVSHAKRDGVVMARRIVEMIQKVNASLGPICFFDVDSLQMGSSYHTEFESAIQNGSLLAVVTSTYHTRPWCRWEVLTAKRHGRPIVAIDMSSGRIERTFPYLGNVPSIRLAYGDKPEVVDVSDDDIARITLALLSESLRVTLWRQRASRYANQGDSLCVRPPEMSDLGVLVDAQPGSTVLYPDPPLSTEEVDLLEFAFPKLSLRSLSQVA